MRIGFVGLGAMGHPMVMRLLDAGHQVAVWARRPEVTQALCAQGAVAYACPKEVAAASEVVFSMLTRDADVLSVLLGEGDLYAGESLIEGYSAGALHIDMSTVAPATARRVAALLREREVAFLDAPVSGGPLGAAAGTLAIMVGGSLVDFARAQPLLQLLGQRIVHVGEQGAGQVAKACNQMIMVATIQAVAEGLALAARSGLDLPSVHTALSGGSARSRVLEVFGQRMVESNYAQGVESRLHHKDFGIILAEAKALNLSLPMAASVGQQLNQLMAQGGGKEDTAGLFRLLTAD